MFTRSAANNIYSTLRQYGNDVTYLWSQYVT